MNEVEFDKYEKKGAYHWAEIEGGVRRLNAYTLGRYQVVANALQAYGIGRSARVLDLGCGDGALAGFLARRIGCAIVGVDTSAAAIEMARKAFQERGLQGKFQLADGYSSGQQAATFDAVVCSDVIEHVLNPKAMLGEIARVLSPGGLAVLTTPIRFTEKPLDPLHVQEWFVSEFVALCEATLGPALQVRRSHPVFWYEAYTLSRPLLGRLVKAGINALAIMGRNPFLVDQDIWRSHTTQMVVLRSSR